jgi:16S rRNA (cytidine1402-2'-O)-methyltransferase
MSHIPAHPASTDALASRSSAPLRGSLWLVPAPLDFGCDVDVPLHGLMPQDTLEVAARLSHWVCENAKSTRAYLKRVHALVPLSQPIQEHTLTELPRAVHKKGDHQGEFDARGLLQAALQGHDIGLISEAGMPALADPGVSVVRAAHQLGLTVRPLVGPSSLPLAMAASGLNGQQFSFVGYLPAQAQERSQRIRELEAAAQRSGTAQWFIETPYRNAALWDSLLHVLAPTTRLACCSGLTLPEQQVQCHDVQTWRRRTAPTALHLPTVFGLGV